MTSRSCYVILDTICRIWVRSVVQDHEDIMCSISA